MLRHEWGSRILAFMLLWAHRAACGRWSPGMKPISNTLRIAYPLRSLYSMTHISGFPLYFHQRPSIFRFTVAPIFQGTVMCPKLVLQCGETTFSYSEFSRQVSILEERKAHIYPDPRTRTLYDTLAVCHPNVSELFMKHWILLYSVSSACQESGALIVSLLVMETSAIESATDNINTTRWQSEQLSLEAPFTSYIQHSSLATATHLDPTFPMSTNSDSNDHISQRRQVQVSAIRIEVSVRKQFNPPPWRKWTWTFFYRQTRIQTEGVKGLARVLPVEILRLASTTLHREITRVTKAVRGSINEEVRSKALKSELLLLDPRGPRPGIKVGNPRNRISRRKEGLRRRQPPKGPHHPLRR